MIVNGKAYRSIWFDHSGQSIGIIDQTLLPHQLQERSLKTLGQVCEAITSMQVRGAPLIGVTAAYGMALALLHDCSEQNEQLAAESLLATRPTAVNLHWAIKRLRQALKGVTPLKRAERALQEADAICEEDVKTCSAIGDAGLELLKQCWQEKTQAAVSQSPTLNILTHCNAGWLATVDWGTALAPIYKAHNAGIAVHVWVDETRPRNQGAHLTAWELGQHGVPYTVISDNTGGHLMQHGMVDLCIVGSDRTSANGDVCNKIGTYLKALAAMDNGIPFYVALPVSTIDWQIEDGVKGIPIEQRDPAEISYVQGLSDSGEFGRLRITPAGSNAANYAFDVTPARLVKALITEKGIVAASAEGLADLRDQL